MKRVLVTGATGFLGRHSLKPLLRLGYEVHAVTARSAEEAERSVGLPVRWHRHDLLDPAGPREAVAASRPSHLLHFAWQVEGWSEAGAEVNRRWLEASLGLLEGFAEAGGSRVVMVGSCTEYDWSHGLCSESETPRRGSTAYGRYKERLRRRVEATCEGTQVSQAWGTVFFLYGPHERSGRLVPSIILSLLRGEPALCSSGEQERDFLHVGDAAAALVALLESDVRGPVNVGSGRATAVRDIALRLAAMLDGEELLRLGALPAGSEESLVVADIERLSREVGFRPRFDLEGGLADTVAWWRERAAARHPA